MSHVYAAAARAAAALGPDAREAVPFLLRALKGEIRDQLITFEDFNQHRSSDGMYTTCKVEALRALAKIGAGAREAVPAIRALLEKPGLQLNATSRMFQAPDVSEEARHALQAIAG
jgi:hypothetical protein